MFNYDRLDEAIRNSGKKRGYLASLLNKNSSVFGDWKAGKSKPKQQYLEILAPELGVSVDYLLGNTDLPLPSQPRDFARERANAEKFFNLGTAGRKRHPGVRPSAQIKKPTPEGELYEQYQRLYAALTPENRQIADALLEKLLKSQENE